jgi:hypothetical protein
MYYADSEDVKRLLRILDVSGNNQYKVRFSESHTVPEAYSTNTGSGVLKDVDIANSYAGSEIWHVDFSSSESFVLYRGEDTSINDGTGNIAADFESISGIISILSDAWHGTPASGDKFKFRTDSNISDADVDGFIDDAQAIVDGKLSEFIGSTHVTFATDLVPKLLSKATVYIAANLIFTSIYSNVNTDQIPPLVRRWFNFGTDYVATYLNSIGAKNIYYHIRYGRSASREKLFTKVGIAEAAGVDGMKGEIDTTGVEADTDWEA